MPSQRHGHPARLSAGAAAIFALVLSLSFQHTNAAAFNEPRLDQRVVSLMQQTGVDSFAAANAFGGAFHGPALTNLQTSFDDGVSTGQISWILEMLDLADLSATSSATFHLGFVNGLPAASSNTYNGNSDLDWWYAPDGADLDISGSPKDQLTASIAARILTSSGSHIRIGSADNQTWVLSTVMLRAQTGASSHPTSASSYQPPGFPASEQIDPAVMASGSMSNGALKGNISASSLAAEPIPAGFLGSACSPGYSLGNTMLDLLVGGCVALGLITEVGKTQPDQVDPTATVAGAGGPYTLSEDSSHSVTTCKDHTAATVSLATCLNAAAYSDYMTFTTDRVIGKTGQGISFMSTPPAPGVPGNTYDVTATGGASPNPVTFAIAGSSTPGTCSISATQVSFLAPGHCIVEADQAGDGNHLVALPALQTISVGFPRSATTQASPSTADARGTSAGSSGTPGPRLSKRRPTPAVPSPSPTAIIPSVWLDARFTRLHL